MPLYKRKDIPALLAATGQGKIYPVYLIFGDRFLCRDAADELINRLLPDAGQKARHLHNIDGDQEKVSRTLGLLRTYNLFAGRQVIRVTDSKLFYSKGVAKTIWDKAVKAAALEDFSRAARYLRQMLNLAGLTLAGLAAEDLAAATASRWKALFGFAKPREDELTWLQELISRGGAGEADDPAAASSAGEPAELYARAFEAGLPPANILMLTAEAVDKRKRLYKYLLEHGLVLDLTVDGGGGAAARQDQEAVLKELVQKTLARFNKTLAPRALPVLLERVGFHPLAAVMETEKLALYVGEAAAITVADLDAIVSRTREEALYEFTEALVGKRLEPALAILTRLQENGIHGLAIISTLRNYFKKLLLIRAFQDLPDPRYTPGLAFNNFQNNYLPALKAGRDQWPELWSSHPYALYKMFGLAAKYSVSTLQAWLKNLLGTEYLLKGSALPPKLLLDDLLFSLLLPQGRPAQPEQPLKS